MKKILKGIGISYCLGGAIAIGISFLTTHNPTHAAGALILFLLGIILIKNFNKISPPKPLCPVCGRQLKLHSKAKDGDICIICSTIAPNFALENIETIKNYWSENNLRASHFQKTSVLKSFASQSVTIDDVNNLLYFGDENPLPSQRYFKFDEISDYSFEQVGGKTITKSKGGIGRAVVGGTLFGVGGAIVGASTSTQETKVVGTVKLLKITFATYSGKVNMSMQNPPNGLIPFLDKCIDKNQDFPVESAADEILKFKLLFDQDVITQDEFEAKKRQLLNL